MLSLGQNHPNPFNPETTIPYDLPHSDKRERVRLWVLDIAGRIVTTLVDEDQGGGSYRVTWLGRDNRGEAVSSGVYFYVLDVGGQRRTKKLVLLK
jgi:flagellar hook assembly protein FlgD